MNVLPFDGLLALDAIELSAFTASPLHSKVVIKWSTESEIDNAGFNLFRAETEDGEYLQINDTLLSAAGSTTEGASYTFADEGLKNRKTYWYKLEDIDLNGVETMHGPVSANPKLMYRIGK